MPRVKAELDGGGDLVDILPARTRGADKVQRDFLFVDGDVGCDLDHAWSVTQ